MNTSQAMANVRLPRQTGLYYGGGWHEPVESGRPLEVLNPATQEKLASISVAQAADVDRAVRSARAGFDVWRNVPPLERVKVLRQVADTIRKHGPELALLDAADCGNPVTAMATDVQTAAAMFDYFAGLVTEIKGASVPMGPDAVNFSVREPLGVVARIVPFNHPFMFAAMKAAAPLAAGNAVIIKPPEQAPLSALLLAELLHGLLPAGCYNVLSGGRTTGEALISHAGVDMVALIGSQATGRAVMRAAAERVAPVLLELGGKNAFIAFPDVDPETIAANLATGMNFTWCGQSCGSTSRAFLHADIHDEVIERLGKHLARFKPGLPMAPETTMGAIINEQQYHRILRFIEIGRSEGAKVVYGGGTPDDAALGKGFFIEPTVFTDVTPDMTLAREEIFGPVLSVLKWSDYETMLNDVNGVEYGLTCSIWTADLMAAHRTANSIEAGYIWVNETSKHFLGTPFGGYKQSGIGREECLEELFAFSREKNIHINLRNVVSSLAANPSKRK